MTENILDASARVPEHVVRRSFEAQTILLNLQTGRYHGLNTTGSRMLELVEGGSGSLREALRELAAETGQSEDVIAPDIEEFCSRLAERGLLEVEVALDP